MIALTGAFLRRDVLTWLTYRIAIAWEFVGMIVAVSVISLVGGLIGEGPPEFVAEHGTTYIGFLLTSIVFVDLWAAGFLLPGVLRQNQSMGVLEAMMLAHHGIFRLLLYSAAWPLAMKLVRFVILSSFAALGLGMWHSANVATVAVVSVATLVTMVILGMLSSAFILVLKQGDPVLGVYALANALLAGVFFPRDAMPEALQILALALPFTHGLDAVRAALRGAGIVDVAPQLIALITMSAILLPLTLRALGWAERRAKQEGSLVQY